MRCEKIAPNIKVSMDCQVGAAAGLGVSRKGLAANQRAFDPVGPERADATARLDGARAPES